MTVYYKIIDGNRVDFPGYIEGELNGVKVVYTNPTRSLIIADGWIEEEIIAPIPEPTPQGEPDMDTVISKLKTLALPTLQALDDKAALEVMECFPTWESLLGKEVKAGERIWDNGNLWKVVQDHTVSAERRPSLDTASLYVKVQYNDDQGTKDNPIPYSMNMELVEGKYYSEDGVTYLCTRALAASYWHLADLVGQYVEIAE